MPCHLLTSIRMNLPVILVIFLFGLCGITIISSQSSGNITTFRCYSCSSGDPCSTDSVGIQQCDPLAGLPCISLNLSFIFRLVPDSGETKTSVISTGCLSSGVQFTPPTRNGCIDGRTYFDLIVPNPSPSLNRTTVDGQACFCDSDLCNTENIQPASPRNCPDGLPPVSCDVNPCEIAECPLNPGAICIANYCNRRQHCLAEWFSEDGNRVDCGVCPDGLPSHQCYVDPCYEAGCSSNPGAVCIGNYCDRQQPCLAEWFNVSGYPVDCDICSDGLPSFQCYVDPCYQAECTSNPDAVCIGNYCNRQQPCLAEWFNSSGHPVDCGVDHCAFQCDDTFAPVCGSDVQTYPNACVLSRVACRDPTIYQVYTGNCTVKARLKYSSSGNYSRTGFVELSEDYKNWYMLCYDGSNYSAFLKVASVVCQELGYGPPKTAYISFLGFLFGESFIGFNDEWCGVDATEVLDCSLEGSYSNHHYMCQGKTLRVECLPAKVEEYDVALAAKHPYTEGVVLIHINGQWGPICRGRAGDTVCRQLGLGPERGSFHGSITTYAPPVLGSLYCDSHSGTIEECSMTSVIDSQCDPEKYLTVSCSNTPYSSEDNLYSEGDVYSEDYFYSNGDLAGETRGSGIFPVYLILIMIVVIGIGLFLLVYHLKRAKANQGHQNPVRARAVPPLTSTVNRQRSPPSSNASVYYSGPGQQVRLSTFQAHSPSGTQEADPAPPYPSTEHQPPAIPPCPPPPYDSDLPKYEDVVKSQIPT